MILNIENVAGILANKIIGAVDGNEKCFEYGDDLESLYEKFFDEVTDGQIPEGSYQYLYQLFLNNDEVKMAIDVARNNIDMYWLERQNSDLEESLGPAAGMKYYGLKSRDFI